MQASDTGNLRVPDALTGKYLRRGDKFHRTPRDKPAFSIKGETIRIDDQSALHDAVRIAKANDWSSITVKGSKAFRQKAYMVAAKQGMAVKGYLPTSLEKLDAERAASKAAAHQDQIQAKVSSGTKPKAPAEKARNAALAERFLAQSHDRNRTDPELRNAQSLVAASVIVARDRYPDRPIRRQKFVDETKIQLAGAIAAGKKLEGLQPQAAQRETIQERIRQTPFTKDKSKVRER
ncbi:hypothetical protein A9995_14140 [Erythrobacter sp. QSSC1-22B]|nr:hypothetical protein A9995_14140 [Erythrobacter sp. QSSC1-22B]